MRISRSASLAVVIATLSFFAPVVLGQEQKEIDRVVKSYLAAQKTPEADVEAVGSATDDLNGDGQLEIVLLWLQLGATSGSYTLTVFSKFPTGYKPVATATLTGEAALTGVKAGIISLNQIVHGKSDPRCCPSVKKQGKYRLVGSRLTEIKR